MHISLMTLGDSVTDPITGDRQSPSERHRSVVEAAVTAEQAGFHGIHIGEHHGLEYIFSAPPVLLAAISERTNHLRLSTAVTLAANLDPVRAAEDYATVDVLSSGRCEVVVGRGNLFESTYPLFGADVRDSHELVRDGVELLLRLWAGETVTWPGSPLRGPIDRFVLQPPPVSALPMWVGGGASEATAELAARLGLDLMLPSVFGSPHAFVPTVEFYRERFASYDHGREPRIGACWHANVAATSQGARRRWEPRYRAYFELMNSILRRVNTVAPSFTTKPFDFEYLTSKGPALVGSPAEVVDRLSAFQDLLGADLHLLQVDMGGQPGEELREMVELIGAEVIPELTNSDLKSSR